MSTSSQLIRNMVLAALFAALLAISGQIAFPIGPVPITLQTMMVSLAAALLGARWGAISVTVWIALAAIGVPVLSGGKSGLAVLFGPTGGYIFGFLFAAFLVGWIMERIGKTTTPRWWQLFLLFWLTDLLVINGLGFAWFLFSSNVSLSSEVFMQTFVIFIPGGIGKEVLATIITLSLYRAMPTLRPQEWVTKV